jgi:hypothetical protein
VVTTFVNNVVQNVVATFSPEKSSAKAAFAAAHPFGYGLLRRITTKRYDLLTTPEINLWISPLI